MAFGDRPLKDAGELGPRVSYLANSSYGFFEPLKADRLAM